MVMEMAVEIDGDGSGGTSPSRQGAGTETFCPSNIPFGGGFHTHGESRDLLKHLSSKVDLLDYKAHDHNMIMHREYDEHIATGRTLSLERELLPPHHGNQQW